MPKLKERIGETSVSSNNQIMVIVDYRGASDIDVIFEDGTVVYNKSYRRFKDGKIKNPNFSHVGETGVNAKGQKMTIVAFRNSNDLDVKFEDGTVVYNKSYYCFKRGTIRNPNYSVNIGKEKRAFNGQMMKIKAYRSRIDIDIEFEDGTIVKNKAYSNFLSGYIKNPHIQKAG